MMNCKWTVLLLLAGMPAFGSACGDDPASVDGDTDADSDADSDADTDADTDACEDTDFDGCFDQWFADVNEYCGSDEEGEEEEVGDSEPGK